jgi:hypothetical protein
MPADYFIQIKDGADPDLLREELERLGGSISDVSSKARKEYGLSDDFLFKLHFSGKNVDDVYAYAAAMRQVSGVRDVKVIAGSLEKGFT